MKLPGVWILSIICLTIFAKSTAEEPRVVCYYTNWSIYRPGNAKYSPQNINPYLCTHLIYAFGGFTKDNTLQPFDKYQDIEKGGYAKFTGLKTYNKNLKTMLAIGGWNEASSRFSPLVGDAERRRIFVKNTIKYLRQNHFDGLDLDWEYPTFRDGGKMKDRVNYAQFVQELREEFDRESSKTGRTRLLLTLAIPAGVDKIEQGYDVVKLNQYLDWFNLLTYDYHDSFEPATNHHAPLFSLEEDDEYNYDGELNIDFSVKYLINAGADRQKLVLGIPTYGRSYTLFNPDATDIGAPTDGPGDPGDATREKGFLAYYEICQNIKSDDEWTVMHPNDNVMGPYLYKDDQWISYDDEKMARKKAEYAAKNGLGGIMFWSIDTDDFRGTCSGKPYPLIEAAKEGFYDALGIKPTDSKEIIVKTTPRNRKRPTRPTKKPVVSNEASTSLKDTFNRRQKPSQTTKVQPTESSIVYNKRTTTPEPPTTPDPGSDFKCEDEGFFSHPRDCKKYFWCLDSGPANLGIVAHQFTCPSGLVFNKQADSCDYARNVVCEKTKPSTTTTGTPPTTTSKTTTRLSTTQRSTTFRTTTSRPTTTSTTTPAYDDDDEEYEDDIEDSEFERDIQDPKVIKELIDLIKKAGGLDKLEKHLKFSEDNSPLFDNTKSDKLSTTQATFSKSLYDKVLLRKPENRFVKNENTNKIKSDREVISVTPKVNNTRYSSVYRNSRPSPQNAGLDNLPDFEGILKEKPQYVTIQRHRTTITTNQNSGEDDDSVEDGEEEHSSAETTTKSVYRTTAQPQYVNIQRNRVTTESTDVDESDFDEFVLNPYSRPIESITQSSFYSTINRGGNTNDGISPSESPVQYSTINRGRKPGNSDSAETASISGTKSTQYTTINRETKLGSSNTVEIALNSERGATQYATVNRGRRPDNSNSEETTTTQDIEATTQYATISSERKSIKSETSENTSTSETDSIQPRPRFNPNRRRRPENSGVTEVPALSETETTTPNRPINRRRRPNNRDTTEISSPSDTESTTEYSTINRRRRPDKSETGKIPLVSEKESSTNITEVSSSGNTSTQTRYQAFSRGATTARPTEDTQEGVIISSQASSTDKYSSSREEDFDAPDKRVFPVIINSNTKYQTITRNQIKTTLLETTLPTIADDIITPQNNTTDLLAEIAIQKETSPLPTPAISVINQYSFGTNLNNTNNELTTKQNQLDHNLTNPTDTINISANQINTDITYTLKSHQSPNIILNDPSDVQAKTVENVTEFITTKLSSPRPFGFQKPNKTILLNQTHDAPKVSQVENLEQNKNISYPINYQQTNLGKNATKQESEIKPLVDRTRFRFTSYTSPNTIIDFEESTTISQITEPNLDGNSLGTQEFKVSSTTGSNVSSQKAFKSRDSATNLGAKTQSYSDNREFRISSSASLNSNGDGEQSTNSNEVSFKTRNATRNLNTNEINQEANIESSVDRRGFRTSSTDSPNELEKTKLSHQTVLESENSNTNLETNVTAQKQKVQLSSDRQRFRISSSTSPNQSEDLGQSTITSQSSFKSRNSVTNLHTNDAAQDAKNQASLDRRGFRISSSAGLNTNEDGEQSTNSNQVSFKSRNATRNLNANEKSQDTKIESSGDRRGFRISSTTSPNSSDDLEQSTLTSQTSFKSRNSTKNFNTNDAVQRGKIHTYSDTREFRISSGISTNSNEDVEQSTISNETSFKSQNSTIHLATNDATQDAKIHSSEDRQGVRFSSTDSPNELEQIAISPKSVLESENSKINLEAKVTAQEQNVQSSSDRGGLRISSSTSLNSSEDLEQSTISSQSSFTSRNSAIILNGNDAQDAKIQTSLDRRGFRYSSSSSPSSSVDLDQTSITDQTSLKSKNSSSLEQTLHSSFDAQGFRISSSTSPNSSDNLEKSTITSQTSFKSRNSITNLNRKDTAQDGTIQSNSDTLGFRISSVTSPSSSEDVEQSTISNQTSFKSENSTIHLTTNDAIQDSADRQGVRISSTNSPNELEQTGISLKSVLDSENSNINLEAKVTAQEQNVQSSSDRGGLRISSSTSLNSSEDLEQSTISSQSSFTSRNSAIILNVNDAAQDAKIQTALDRRGFRYSSSSSPTSSVDLDQTSITDQTSLKSRDSSSLGQTLHSSFDAQGFRISSSTSPNSSDDLEKSTITSQSSFKSRNSITNLNSKGTAQDGKIQSNSDTLGFKISSVTSPSSSEDVEQSTVSNQTSFKSQNSTISLTTNDATKDVKIHSSEGRQGVRISSTNSPNELEQITISHKRLLESENSAINLETKSTAQEQNVQSSSDRGGLRIPSSTSANPSENLEHSTITSQTSLKSRNSTTNLNSNGTAQNGKIQSNSDTLGFRISSVTSPNLSEDLEQSTISNQSLFKSQNSSTNFNSNDVAQDAKIQFSGGDRRGNTNFEQNSISHQTVIESENETIQGQTIQSSFDREGFRISSSFNPNSKEVGQSTISSHGSFKSRNSTITLKTNGTAEDVKVLDSSERRGIKISSTASPSELDQATISNETVTINLGSTSIDGQGLDISSSASSNEIDQVITSKETLQKTQISITNLDSNDVNQEFTTSNLGEDLELTTIYSQTPFESRETTTEFITTDTVEEARNKSTVDRQGLRISPSSSFRESQNSAASIDINNTTHEAKTKSSFDRHGFRISSSTSPKSITGFEKSSISSQSLIESQNSKENLHSISTTTQATQTKPTIHRGRIRPSASSSPKSTIDTEQATSSRQFEFESRNTQETDRVINSNALLNRNARPTNFDELSSLTSIDFNRRTSNNGSPTVVRRRLRPTKVTSTTTLDITPESTERSRIRQRVRILQSTTPNSFNDFNGTNDSNTRSSFDRRGNRISSSARLNSSTDFEKTNLSSKQTNQKSSFNISSSTSPKLNLFETISSQTSFGSQNSTTSLDITNIAQEAKSQFSIDTPQMAISHVDLYQTTISNVNTSSPDSIQQPTISSQTLFKSQNSVINLNTNDAAQDGENLTSKDSKGFRITSTGSPSSSIDLDQTTISNQTSFVSRNSSRRGQTVQPSVDARGFKISSTTESSSEGLDQSSITSQSSFKSQNSAINLNTNGNVEDAKIQASLDARGFRIVSSTSPNSISDLGQATISDQTSFKSRNHSSQGEIFHSSFDKHGSRISPSTSPISSEGLEKSVISGLNLNSNDFVQDEKIEDSLGEKGFRISSAASPNELAQTTITNETQRETQASSTNLGSNEVTTKEIKFQSSSANFEQESMTNQTFVKSLNLTTNLGSISGDGQELNVSSTASPNEIDQETLHKTQISTTNLDSNAINQQSITPNSGEDSELTTIYSQNSFESRNTTTDFGKTANVQEVRNQSSVDRRGFRISSSTSPKSSSDFEKSSNSSQSLVESHYSKEDLGSIGTSTQAPQTKPTIHRRRFRVSTASNPKSTIDTEQTTSSRQFEFESRNTQETDGVINSNALLNRNARPTNFDELSSLTSIDFNRRTYNNGSPTVVRRRLRPTKVTSPTTQAITPESTERSRIRQRVRILPSTTPNSYTDSERANDSKTQSSFDRRGYRISTPARPNSSTDFKQTNLSSGQTNEESSYGRLGFNIPSSTSTNSSLDVEQKTISSQTSIGSQNSTISLDITHIVQEVNLDSNNSTDEPEYATISNDDLEQSTISNLASSSPDSAQGFEQPTISSQTLFDSRNSTSNSTTSQEAKFNSNLDRRGFRISSSESPISIIEETTNSNQILFQSRNSTANQRNKASVDRRRLKVSYSTNRPATAVNFEQTTSSRQILPETKSWVINRNRGTRKFFSRFTTEALETFTETPYRSNFTRKSRPVYQETEEVVNYNSLLDRSIRPASLDELSSLTAFDFNRKNNNNGNTVIRRRPRPKVVTTTTTTAEEITSTATESSSSTESTRIYKRPVIPRHRFLPPTSTTANTPSILSDPKQIIDSNSQIDTPSTDPSISLSLSKSYEFGFASRKENSTVQTVFENDSSRISNINVTNAQSQDSTFSDQTNLTMPATEQIFQIDTTTVQILPIAQNSLNVTTENNLSTTNNIVTNSSQHVPLSDSKSPETIKTRSRVRTVKRLRDPVKYIENTIETSGNTESRPAINFGLAANPTIETVANEGFNFQTTNTTTINSILINQTESDSQIRSRISTRAPNAEEPSTQTERRRQFQSRTSTTPIPTLVTKSNSNLTESEEGFGSSNTTKETRYKVVNQTFKRRPGTKLEINSNDTLEENVEANIERTKSVPKFNARTRRPRPFKKQETNSEETDDVGIVEDLPLADEELKSSTRKNSFIPPRRAFASRTTTTPATVVVQTESQHSENITSTSEPKLTSRPRFKVFNRSSTKKPTTQPDVNIAENANSEEDLSNEEIETSSKIETSTQPRRKFAPRFSATQSKIETDSSFSGNTNSVKNNVRTFTRKPIINASPTDNDNNSGENLPVDDEELDSSIPIEATTESRRKFFGRPITAKATVNTQLSNETKTEVSENIDVSRQQNSSLPGRRKFISRVPATPINLNTQSVSENVNSTKVPRYNLLNRTRKPFAKPVIKTEDDKSEENLPLVDEEVDSVTLNTEINLVTDGYADSAPQTTTLEDENTEETFTASTEELKAHTSTVGSIKPRRVIKVVKGTKRPVIELKLDSAEELDQGSTEENVTSTERELDQTTQNEPNDETTRPFPILEINAQDEENLSEEDSELEFNAQKTSRTYAPTTITTPTTSIEDVFQNLTSTNAPRFKVFNRTFTRRPITQPETDDKPKENLSSGNEEVEPNSQNGTTIQSSRKYVSRVSTAQTNAEIPERPRYKVRAFTRKPTTRPTTTSIEQENSYENISSGNEEVESSSAPGSSVPTRRTLRPRFSTTPSTVSKKVNGEIRVSENVTATNASRFKPFNRTFTRRPSTKLDINSDGSNDDSNSDEKTFVSEENDESQNITSTEYRKYTSRTSTTTSSFETESQVGFKVQTLTRKPVASEADDEGGDSEDNLALDNEEVESNTTPDVSISTTPTNVNTNESDEAEIRVSENVTTTLVQRPSVELEINSNGTIYDHNSDENSQYESIGQNDTFESNITRTSTNQTDFETEISVSGNKNLTDLNNNGEENLAPENEQEDEVESDTETNFSIPTRRTYVTGISTTPTTVNIQPKEGSEQINSTSAPRFKAFNRTFTPRPAIKPEISSNGSNVDDNNSEENSPISDEDDESNSQIDSSTQSRRLYISRTSTGQTNSETEKRVAGNGYKIRAFTRKPISNEPDNDDIGSEENLDNEHIESNVQVDTSTSTRRTFTPRLSIKSLKIQSNDESEVPVSENINSNRFSLENRTRKPFGQLEINFNGSDDGENSEEILDDEDVEAKIQIDATTERRKYISRITTTPVPPPIKYKVINRPVSKSPFTTPKTQPISNGSNDGDNIEENSHDDEEDEASEEVNSGNVNSAFPRYKTIDRTSTRKPFSNVNESDDNENSEGSQTNSETESRISGNINSFNAPRYGVINRTRKPFTRPEVNSNTPDDDYNSEENSHVDYEEDEASIQSETSGNKNSGYKTFDRTNGRKPFTRLQINANEPDDNENEEDSEEFESNSQINSASQTGSKLQLSVTQTNSETENRVSGNINSFNAPRYGVINRPQKPFTRPEVNLNTPDSDNNSEENSHVDDEEDEASLQSGSSDGINSRYKSIDRTSTRKPFTRLELNANEHENNENTEDSQEFESNSQIDSASQTGNKYVSRLSVTQKKSETENRDLGNISADNAPRYGVVNRTRKPFTRPEINSRTPEGNENSEANSPNNPSSPLRKKFVPRVSNIPTSVNLQSENRVVGNIPKFRTASPRPSPNLAIQIKDEDFDENESAEDGYDSFEENLTGNNEEVNSYSKIDTSTQSIRKFKPNSSNSINLNTPTSTEPSLPAGYRNKAIFQRKPYERPSYTNEPSESDNSEETVTLKTEDKESNTESDLNNDDGLVETTTIQGELISETISKINNNFTQTNNNSEGALWSTLSQQTNSTIYKILGSNVVDFRNESESLVQVNRSNNSPATQTTSEKVINKPFSIRTQNSSNKVQSTQISSSQNSPVQSIKIDSGKFIPFHLRPKTTFNKPSVQATTPTIRFSHDEVETTTGSIPNTDYTNIPHSTTLDTSTPIISTLADTILYSTLISQESTTTFAGDDIEKVTTEISINPIKMLKPTTTTSKPTTLHHIFAVDYDSAEEDRNNGTNLGNSTELMDDDNSGNSKEASAEEISQRLEKLVEINRIVEIYSKQQSNGRNDLSANSNELILEKIPTIDKIGEISRWISVKLQNHNSSSSSSNKFHEILQNITQLATLNSTANNATFDSNMIFNVETSTIPLEGLFDKNKKNFTDNEVIDYQVTKPPLPSTPLASLVLPPPPSHTIIDSNPQNSKSFAGSTSFGIAAATIPSHSYVQQLRPESHEANPLVISIANLDQVVLSKSDKIDKKISFPSIIGSTESSNQLTFSSNSDNQTN